MQSLPHNLHERPSMKQLETEWWLIEVSTRTLKVINSQAERGTSGGVFCCCSKRMSHGSRRSTFVCHADADDESRPSTIGNVVERMIREWKPSSENRPMPTTAGDCQLGASEGKRSTCQVTTSFLEVSSIVSWVNRDGGHSTTRRDE